MKKLKQKSNDVDYSVLAETIAKEIYNDGYFDIPGMTSKIKILLRMFITNTGKGLAILKLRSELELKKNEVILANKKAELYKAELDKFSPESKYEIENKLFNTLIN